MLIFSLPYLGRAARHLRLLGGCALTLGLLLPVAAAPEAPQPEPAATQPAANSSTASAAEDTPDTPQEVAMAVSLIPLPGHGPSYILVRPNGEMNAKFLVDTGSDFVVIAQSLADRLGLKSHPYFGANGKPGFWHGKQAKAVTLDSLEFPDAVGSSTHPSLRGEYLVLPDSDLFIPPDLAHLTEAGTYIDGIIGTPILNLFAAIFDFNAHSLTLYSPGKLSAKQARLTGAFGPGGISLPLSLAPGQTENRRYFIPVGLTSGGVSRVVSLAVDTGAEMTIVPRWVVEDLHLKKTGQQRQYGPEGDFQAGEVQVPVLALDNLQKLNASVIYPLKGDFFPVLGVNILSGYKVLMDFPAKKMYLQPILPAAPPVAEKPPAPKP